MAIANWLLNMAVYMLIPVMPLWLLQDEHFSALETGLAMGVFGVGIYVFGGFCSYLVQRFRRNHVCVLAILLMALSVALLQYVNAEEGLLAGKGFIFLQRLSLGAFFGLAQMILSSTLIIDISESFQRTEANYSAAWFSRFALALGPIAGMVVYRLQGFEWVVWAAVGCCLAAVLFIHLVNFPFRTPDDDVSKFCLDRFLLPQGMWLFVNMLLVTTAVGLLMTTALSDWYYAIMTGGFLLAILAQRFVFPEAELKSEIVSGLILLGGAVLFMLVQAGDALSYISPLSLGLGVGIIGSRFLLFFIKLSRHCQRGTSQSTFLLSWETGLSLGLFLGYAFFYGQYELLFSVAFGLIVAALLLYNFFTHHWFITHKNR